MVELERETTWKLEAESISTRLAVDIAEERRKLQAKSDELDILSTIVRVVYGDLEVERSEGTSSLVAPAIEIMVRVC